VDIEINPEGFFGDLGGFLVDLKSGMKPMY
jgi:hypothetical protein